MARKDSTALNWFLAMSSVAVGMLIAGTVMAGVNKALSAGGVTEFFPTTASTNGTMATATTASTATGGLTSV